MANEIDASIRLALNDSATAAAALKSLDEIARGSLSAKSDQATALLVGNVQSLTTTATAIDMGSVTAAGYGFFRNLDATDDIEIGKDVAGTFHAVAVIKPGKAALFHLAISNPFARGTAGTPKLYYKILST